jgi:dihydrofolate reductase
MRKIVNSTYISLDGVVEAPHTWPPTGLDDEAAGRIQTELLLSCDAVLMGRRTYEGFAPVWPTRSGDPYSDRIRLSHALMANGLLDELRLWVHPLFVGSGGPDALIYRDGPVTTFELRDTTPLASGTVVLTYAA